MGPRIARNLANFSQYDIIVHNSKSKRRSTSMQCGPIFSHVILPSFHTSIRLTPSCINIIRTVSCVCECRYVAHQTYGLLCFSTSLKIKRLTSLSGSRVKTEPEVCRLKSQRLHISLQSITWLCFKREQGLRPLKLDEVSVRIAS